MRQEFLEHKKKVIEEYGYDKIYKEGFNIKTPINLELQNLAASSLRKGLLEYDKEKDGVDQLLT